MSNGFKKKDKSKPFNRTKCDVCGYWNDNDYVKYSGVCHGCGKILDEKAYFKQTMYKKLRLWRGKRVDKWDIKEKMW